MCLPVDGPKLLAKHFADAIAAFTQVAPDTELGFSPVPGAVRVIRPLELQGMASRLGVTITLPMEGVSFEWTLAPLDSSRVAEAMQKVLPEGARLEVTEVSRATVPAGELEFPLKGLNAGFWRGQVKYGQNGRIDVWARVRVSVKQTRVLTVTPLKPGEVIRAEQLRVDELRRSLIRNCIEHRRYRSWTASKTRLSGGFANPGADVGRTGCGPKRRDRASTCRRSRPIDFASRGPSIRKSWRFYCSEKPVKRSHRARTSRIGGRGEFDAMKALFILFFLCLAVMAEKQQKQIMTPLEAYIQESNQSVVPEGQTRGGSLWSPDARFGNLSSDLRSRNVNDILTIIVQERASAVSRG